MRRKFARNRLTRVRELVIVSQRGETLDTRRAKWLSDGEHDVLLNFSYDMARDGVGATLHYDVHGLVSLTSYLKRFSLDDTGMVRLLGGIQSALDACSSHGIPTEHLVFDPRYVFIDDKSQPRFVVVPLNNVPFEVGNSPLAMLKVLGDPKHLAFSSPAAEMLASRLELFVLNQNNVFSANAYRAFLRDECGIGQSVRNVSANVRVRHDDATREQGDTAQRMWSPLDNARSPATEAYTLERVSSGERFPLAAWRQVEIGRGSQNDIQLTGNPKLSRAHVELRCSGEHVVLRDMGSANGTWVAGRRLSPSVSVSLPVGQRFSLANEEFVVRKG